MTTILNGSAPAAALPAIIVLGRDDAGKPHASWFDTEDVAAATHAANVMGMAALPVAGDELRDLAIKLPKGKLFSTGRAFVPFVKGETFERLINHLPEPLRVRPVVVRQRASVKKATAEADGPEQPGQGGEGGAPASVDASDADWAALSVGRVVLACENQDEGWFTARVVQVVGNGTFKLRWVDWIDLPPFTRKAEQIALLHPRHPSA